MNGYQPYIAVVPGLMCVIAIFAIPRVQHHRLRRRNLRLARSLVGIGRQLPYREIDDDEPQVAFRFAYLILDGGQPAFRSILHDFTFGTVARAECKEHHPAPAEGCRCGLYSLLRPNAVLEQIGDYCFPGSFCMLRVSLSGKIIQGDKGIRAARQDVLRVWLLSQCSRSSCRRTSTTLVPKELVSEGGIFAPAARTLVPVCSRHAGWRKRTYSLSELHDVLGVQFSWME